MAVGFNRSAGQIVLALWLILHGILYFVPLGMPPGVMPALAFVGGVLILVGR